MKYYKEQQKAFNYLDKIISSGNDFDINYLKIEMQKMFMISSRAIDKKLEQYKEAGLLTTKKKD